jgi:uncharacterized protein YjbI with pentapeptide repeats
MTQVLQQRDTVKDFSRQRFYSTDFSGQDLRRAQMRSSVFYNCKFDNADMTEADCTGSEFTGSSFEQTNCYRTNFRDAALAGTHFNPKDCMGMTITLSCKTFKGMKVGALWFYAYLLFATMMHPFGTETSSTLVDKVIDAIGTDRWVKLKALFGKREF